MSLEYEIHETDAEIDRLHPGETGDRSFKDLIRPYRRQILQTRAFDWMGITALTEMDTGAIGALSNGSGAEPGRAA